MIRAIIKNLAGQEIARGKFPGLPALNTWIAENVASRSWGEPDRWVEESRLAGLGLLKVDAYETSTLANPYPAIGEPAIFNLYRYAAEYTIQTKDVSQEDTDQADLDSSLDAIHAGFKMVARIRRLNKRKLAAGSMDNAGFSALMQDAAFERIERLIFNGSFDLAKIRLGTFDSGDVYFTISEKNSLISQVDKLVLRYP